VDESPKKHDRSADRDTSSRDLGCGRWSLLPARATPLNVGNQRSIRVLRTFSWEEKPASCFWRKSPEPDTRMITSPSMTWVVDTAYHADKLIAHRAPNICPVGGELEQTTLLSFDECGKPPRRGLRTKGADGRTARGGRLAWQVPPHKPPRHPAPRPRLRKIDGTLTRRASLISSSPPLPFLHDQ
jgi:hypothetical protein